VVTSRATAEKLSAPILAEVGAFGTVAGPDQQPALPAVNAIRKALAKSGKDVRDLDLIEINEAFAAVGIASMGALGVSPDIVNVNGGAIAIGHPLARRARGSRSPWPSSCEGAAAGSGAAALCGGGGQGSALLLRVPR